MRLVQREGRRIARFLRRRDSNASAVSSTSSAPSPTTIPEGPEWALPPTTTPVVATSKSFPVSSQTLIALSILVFIALGM